MQYSVAGGRFHPWAAPQMERFVVGLGILVGDRACRYPRVDELAYPAYGLALLAARGDDRRGHIWATARSAGSRSGRLQLQPSELMKISLVLALARYLHGLSVEDVSKPLKLAIPLGMIAVPAVLVLMEPNLGTATILMADGCSLLFLAGLSWWWIVPAVTGVVAAVPSPGISCCTTIRSSRVMTFLNPANRTRWAPAGTSARRRSRWARAVSPAKASCRARKASSTSCPKRKPISSSRRWARNSASWVASRCWLLFATVIFYGVRIAMASRSQFGRLLAMGITLNFFFYIMINAAMVMGLIPVVGIPMPLISYGGTAMLTVMFGFGLLMSVHVHRQVEIPRSSGGII